MSSSSSSRPALLGAAAGAAAAATAVGVGLALWRRQAKAAAPAAAASTEAASEPVSGARGAAAAESLAEVAAKVADRLRERKPPALPEGVDPGAHELPPYIPKALWEELGRGVRDAERPTVDEVHGSQWISLRLDGCGFSMQTRRLRRLGVLEQGFSTAFGEIMRECAVAVMETFHACLSYTQSDEMTILIPSTRVLRGEQQPHIYGGRVLKLCSIAASTATALFNRKLEELAAAKGIEAVAAGLPLAHFDCRVGVYNSEAEALALVLWRAQDCAKNGVSDAILQTEGAGKERRGAHTMAKLAWLAEQGRLPLHPHQAYGSLFLRQRRLVTGTDPRTGETKEAMRRVTLQVNLDETAGIGRNVLSLFAEGKLKLVEAEEGQEATEAPDVAK